MKTCLINAVIYKSQFNTLVIKDNVIEKLGNYEDFNMQEIDEIIDCKNQFVCPGFNDSHMHLLGTGAFLSNLQLHDCRSLDEVYEIVKNRLDYIEDDQWIIGRGWNQDYFKQPVYPTRSDLDLISKDVPIFLTRCCGHVAVCNSKAIELAGVDKNSVVDGGVFDLEIGLFKEMAMDLITRAFKPLTNNECKKMFTKAINACHKEGITSVQSDDFVSLTSDFTLVFEVLKEMDKNSELNIRIHQQCQFLTKEDLRRFLEVADTNEKYQFFSIGPLKVLADGSLGARTAKLSRPYSDDIKTSGLMNYSQEEIDYFVQMGEKTKMGVIFHAIGDGCLDMILNSFEKYGSKGNPLRSGIVHCQITRADQLNKIASLKLHVYFQSCFLDYDNSIVVERVGGLAETSYAFKTLKDTTTASNGSDAPVEPLNCFKGVECAVTRESIGQNNVYNPQFALSIEEAIDSYTKDGAYASFEEGIKGEIKEGQLADIIILDKNPFLINPKELHTIQVQQTIFNGTTVFKRV